MFYDTQALSPEEMASLSQHDTPEGCIVIVYPRASKKVSRTVPTWEFVREQKKDKPEEPVDAIAIAGVGSSALGTASLCRDVADYLGRPVAGIVSGLGMSDVITEALGGAFVFGMHNAMRDALARAFDFYGYEDHVRSENTHERIKEHFSGLGVDTDFFIYGCPDSTALLYILSTLGPKIKLLVGHSKGNLSIENALEGLRQVAKITNQPIQNIPEIVTLGAVTWFAPEFNRLHQFLGQIDVLGTMNSRWDVARVRVPWAGHTLNPGIPIHVSVADSLKTAGVR